MNQRKAKQINRLASKLIQESPERYTDETIIHKKVITRDNRVIPITQKISGKRKAKKMAKAMIS